MTSKKTVRRALTATALSSVILLATTGCVPVLEAFGSAPSAPGAVAQAPAATPTPTPTLLFDSVFTDMGSIHPTTVLANQLELEVDLWTEQKTHEWFTDSDKLFSFVINVYDRSVPAEATFDRKRRVYMSNISVSATTATTSGASETVFTLQADPLTITKDPEALRSEHGLLITSPKGGFQNESNRIGVLAPDTYGLTLDIAMTVSYEGAAGSNGYSTQVVHELIPVAIFARR